MMPTSIVEILQRTKPLLPNYKRCARCKQVKPVSEFYSHNNTSGLNPYCKVCFKQDIKKRITRKRLNPAAFELEKITKVCTRCGRTLQLINYPKDITGKFERASICKPCWTIRIRQRMDTRRLQALARLDPEVKCARCDFKDIRALQIDHINGGGNREFREIGTEGIIKNILTLPLVMVKKKYQILCVNCNFLKSYPTTPKYNKRLKVLTYLSNNHLRCIQCGSTTIRTLQLDHKNSDGYKERKELSTSKMLSRILEMPLGEAELRYQVLCGNCNMIKKYEKKEFRR